MEIHETIEECMIFANHWVAKKIAETFPTQALVDIHFLLCWKSFTLIAIEILCWEFYILVHVVS